MNKTFITQLSSEKIQAGKTLRVCAFGSSNTQRFNCGMHWFDCLELGFKTTYGPASGLFLNAGICGNTSTDLLKRIDSDVLAFHPDSVILTIGGNDAWHVDQIPEARFLENLKLLHKKITASGSEVIFQTYYACDLERMPDKHPMPEYMELVRTAARETGAPLHDNDIRWERLRKHDSKLYRLLMKDFMHVNALGNLVLGCDWMRDLKLRIPEGQESFFSGALFVQKTLDLLEE